MLFSKLKWPKQGAIVMCVAVVPVVSWIVWERVVDIRYKTIKTTGTIQAKEIAVASKIGGRIKRIPVKEGQLVAKDDLILEFEIPEMEAREEQLRDQVEVLRQEYLEYKNGPRPQEIEEAKAVCAEAQSTYERLQHGYQREEIEKAKHSREEAEANLQQLVTGYRKEDIEHARSLMEEARIRSEWLERDWRRYEELAQAGAVPSREAQDVKSRSDASQRVYLAAKQNFEKQLRGPRLEEINAAKERVSALKAQEELLKKGYRREDIEVARQEYLAKKARVSLLMEGTRKERIERAKAALQQSEATLAELRAQMKDRVIVAPAPAEVSIMDLHAGELIPPNKSVVTLTRLDDVWTRVYIPARELSRVTMGQQVEVRVDSFPGRIFEGRIVQIPSSAEFTPRNIQTAEERSAQVFGLKVQIDNPQHVLRGGMNAEISFRPVFGPFAAVRIAGKNNGGRSNSLR